MKKTLAILLALCLVLGCLAGCGGKDEGGSSKKESAGVEIETGTYQATSCMIDGEEYSCEEDALIIEEDGEGILVFEGDEYSMEWELKGSSFSFEDEEGSTFEGTYEDGVIEGVLDGMDYVFEKEASGGGKAPAAAEPEDEPEEEPEEAPAGEFEPVSGTVAGYEVAVVGAELITDMDDKDGIRLYWDFTNNSDESIYAGYDIEVAMEQEGFELTSTYCSYEDDAPEYGNSGKCIRPGVSIRCVSEFNCKPDGDIITVNLYEWGEEDSGLIVELDPTNLPGRPAEDLAIEPILEPTWTNSMSDEGDVGDAHVYIDTAEIVEGWDSDEEVIRVYFDYTNNGEEAASMWWQTYVRAFQDGIELETDWAAEDVPEDDNFDTDIEPGESLRCSECWVIRSDSPIEIEVYDSWNDEYVGCYFEFQ